MKEQGAIQLHYLWLFIEWGCLALGIATFTITEEYNIYVTAGFTLLVFSFLARALRTGRWIPKTGMEAPIALFIVSGLWAAWIAYDHSTAILQFFRILAGVALYYAIVCSSEKWLAWLASGFVFAAAVLAIYWPTQYDFLGEPAKVALITNIGIQINALIPKIPGPAIHANVAAGTLAMAIPFGLGLTWHLVSHRRGWLALLAGMLTAVILSGLVLTSSRGGWLAVVITGLAAGLVLLQQRWFSSPRARLIFYGVLVVGVILLAGGILTSGIYVKLLGQIPDPTGTMQGRDQLWKQGAAIARDYWLTGSGLTSYWNVGAIYGLLIHTPYLAHAHNTFLQVWIEQGIVGVIALLWVGLVILGWVIMALGKRIASIWGWTGLAALVVIFIHNQVDVVFYFERTLPLVGFALGYAWFLHSPALPEPGAEPARKRSRVKWAILAVTLAIVLSAGVIIYRIGLSRVYSSIGAVLQTEAELRVYDPDKFDSFSMDQVRQAVDLSPAISAFQRALSLDGKNRTALQRLAQIALSRGDYLAAMTYSQQLWEAGYRDDVTRLTYGDALVANGQPEAAVEVVSGLTWAEFRLRGQAWYRYWVGKDYERAANAWQAVLLLNPGDQDLQYWLEQALEKSK